MASMAVLTRPERTEAGNAPDESESEQSRASVTPSGIAGIVLALPLIAVCAVLGIGDRLFARDAR